MLKFLLRRMDHQQVASNQSAPALQVGVLTRTVRGLGDGPNIFAALQKALPDAELNITTFDHMKFPQQAGWVNRHDIIVCPHGAQNLNFLFVRHCAVVLEVYPHKYYILGYYLSLARLAGARAFEAYPGPNALQDGRRTAVDAGARQKARVETIAITAADVLQILPALLEARLQCLAGQPEANLTSVQLEGEARSSQGAQCSQCSLTLGSSGTSSSECGSTSSSSSSGSGSSSGAACVSPSPSAGVGASSTDCGSSGTSSKDTGSTSSSSSGSGSSSGVASVQLEGEARSSQGAPDVQLCRCAANQ